MRPWLHGMILLPDTPLISTIVPPLPGSVTATWLLAPVAALAHHRPYLHTQSAIGRVADLTNPRTRHWAACMCRGAREHEMDHLIAILLDRVSATMRGATASQVRSRGCITCY